MPNPGGKISIKDIADDAVLNFGQPIAQTAGVAIAAVDKVTKAFLEMNKAANAYRGADNMSNVINNRKVEANAITNVISALKAEQQAITNLQKQVQELTAKQILDNEIKKEKNRILSESKAAIDAETLAHKQSINAIKESQAAAVKSSLETKAAIDKENLSYRESVNSIKETEAAQIALERTKREKIKTDKAEVQVVKEAERAIRNQKDAYGEMSAELNRMFRQTASVAVEMYKLKEAGQSNTPAYAALNKEFVGLRAETLKLDGALKQIDSSLGRNQRNVGNYKFDSLGNSIQQILREAPSAAVSLNTFFLAISNNLPLFFDAITGVKGELGEIKEAAMAANLALAQQQTEQSAIAGVASQAEEALSNQVETLISSVSASREQAAAIREQVVSQLSEVEATGVATAETIANTEATLLNAGATVEEVAATQASIIATAESTTARTAATASLNAQTVATAEANAALSAQPTLLQRISKSLFSVNTALTLGVLALTLYGGKVIEIISNLFDFNKELDNIEKAQLKFATASNTAAKEFSKQEEALKALQAIAKNQDGNEDARALAVKKLREQYQYYYKDLTDVQILNKTYSKSEQELLVALSKRTQALEKQKEIDNIKARVIDLRSEINAREEIYGGAVALREEYEKLGRQLEKGGNINGLQISARRAQITEEIKSLDIQGAKREEYMKTLEKNNESQKAINESSLDDLKREANQLDKFIVPKQKEVNKLTEETILLDYKEEKSKKSKFNALKDYENDLSNLIIFRLTRLKEQNDAIVEDESRSLEARQDAQLRSQEYEIEIARETTAQKLREASRYNDKIRDLSNEEIDILVNGGKIKKALNNDEILALEQFASESQRIRTESAKKLDGLFISDFEKQQAIRQREFENSMNQDLINENNRFAQEATTLEGREFAIEQHEKKILEIKRQYAIRAVQEQIGALEALLANESLNADERREIEGRLSDARLALSEKTAEVQKGIDNETAAKAREQLEALVGLASELAQALTDFVSTLFDNRISKIDEEIEKNQEFYDKQIELAGNDASQKELLEAESEKKREALERKKREEQRKQAIFNKAFNAAQIIQQTSLAIISALAQVPKFDFGISAGAIAAAYGAIGALQLANLLATPIPKYKTGRKGGKEEIAWVGDGGVTEVIESKSGNARFTPNTATLTLLQQGDTVHKSKEDYFASQRAKLAVGMSYENKKLNYAQHLISGSNNSDSSMVSEIRKEIKEGFKNAKVINQNNMPKIDINHQYWVMGNNKW